jgi:transposase-like protein
MKMDKVRKVTREYRASQWAETVKECRNSGQTIRDWCIDNDVSEKSFYYWQRKFREQACQVLEQNTSRTSLALPLFAEVSLEKEEKPKSSAATIRVGEMTAEIHNGADPATIETVIRTLKTLC